MRLVLSLLGLATPLVVVAACSSDTCDDKTGMNDLWLPPLVGVRADQVPPNATSVEDPTAEAGAAGADDPSRTVWVTIGTLEEWTSIPCMDACRRAKELDLIHSSRVTTRCSFSERRLKAGPLLTCFYEYRECTETR